MKRAMLAAVVLALVVMSGQRTKGQAASGIFPSPPWCPTCFVASAMDAPVAGSVVGSDSVVWGWAGVCETGAVPTHVAASVGGNGMGGNVPVMFVFGGPREDVTEHLQANGCHGGHTVIAAWFPDGIPSWATQVSVQFWRQGIFSYHVFQVQH